MKISTPVFIDGLWIAFAAGVATYSRLNYATRTCGIGIEAVMLVFGCTSLASDPNLFDTRQTTTETVLVALPLCTLLSVALGHVFHRTIERRFLNSPSATETGTAEKQVSASVPCPA